ncbi:MAG: hypothetical protein SFZ24_03300 [Planctomycetota bacterium]|nr:hypothetical protein [Planctomycetota bacterium]
MSHENFGVGARLLAGALGLGICSAAMGQVATALVREGDTVGGGLVTGIDTTTVNHAGGWAATLITNNAGVSISHVFGNAGFGAGSVLRSEATIGSLAQTSFESFFGIDNSGKSSYSASGTGGPVGGFDSVFYEDTPLAVEGDPVASLPGLFWSFASRPGVTAEGVPYWAGGTRTTPGGTTSNRGLFYGVNGTPLLLGGQNVPGLPLPLNSGGSTVAFDYRFSKSGSNYLAEVQLTGATSADAAMVKSGSGLVVGGTLVREGNMVPAVAGGNGVEAYQNFGQVGITESGRWMITGDTNAIATADAFVMIDGVIVLREGQAVGGGGTLNGNITYASMNEDGDWAAVANVSSLESLLLNGNKILGVNDLVDITGDGVPDANGRLADFTGIASMRIADRRNGLIDVYFTADVDVNNTPGTAADDVEAAFRITVVPAPAGALVLLMAGGMGARRRR